MTGASLTGVISMVAVAVAVWLPPDPLLPASLTDSVRLVDALGLSEFAV